MTSFFRTARETLAQELERFRNRRFLEATMAASALVALADGEVNFTELTVIDQALEVVHELNLYAPHKAVDIYRDYIEGLRADAEATRDKAFDAVARIAGDGRAARVPVRVCVAIGTSDEDFSEPEKKVIRELCRVLELDPAEVGL